MSNPMRWLMGVVIYGLAMPMALAQQTEISPNPSGSPPSAPLVRPVVNGTTWLLQAKTSAELARAKTRGQADAGTVPAGKGGFELRRVRAAFQSGVCKALVEYGNKARQDFYFMKGHMLIEHPRTREIVVTDSLSQLPPGGLTDQNGRFREFAWIANEFFLGTQLYRERPCHVYRQYAPGPAARPAPQAEPEMFGDYDLFADIDMHEIAGVSLAQARKAGGKLRIIRTAFIDQETRLPVALENSDGVWEYEFGTAKEPFTLPVEFANVFRAEFEAVERLQRKYNIPQ